MYVSKPFLTVEVINKNMSSQKRLNKEDYTGKNNPHHKWMTARSDDGNGTGRSDGNVSSTGSCSSSDDESVNCRSSNQGSGVSWSGH